MQMHEQVGSSAALPPPEHLRTTRARSRRVSDACTCAQCRPAHVLHALRRGSVWSGRAGLRTCCRFLSSTRTSSPRCPVLGAPCGARAKQQRGHVRGASLPRRSDRLGRYYYEGFKGRGRAPFRARRTSTGCSRASAVAADDPVGPLQRARAREMKQADRPDAFQLRSAR